MTNYFISNDKTLFDIFNMINPNCYQALIIKSIIEYNKNDAIVYCDELKSAYKYYNWSKSKIKSDYVDSLIYASDFEKWQKQAILYIISNEIDKCISVIKGF